MAVFKSVDAWKKSLATRLKKRQRLAESNVAKAAAYLEYNLKVTAPVNRGELLQSVRRRKLANGRYSVLAGYNNGTFNVGRWVNQDFTSRFGVVSFQPFFRRGQTVMYGRPAITPAGDAVKWTARDSPWFDNNVRKMQRKYRAGYKQVRAALRA